MLRSIRLLLFTTLLLLSSALTVRAEKLLLPMDLTQTNHLRAYGVTYNAIKAGADAEWLLNYRGGSFMIDMHPEVERVCRLKGVRSERVSDAQVSAIYEEIEQSNMERVRLEKAPDIAVYQPPDIEPWDDAVSLVLEYVEIPFDKVYDTEVLGGQLKEYDWLHLHHEDFTGQYGKFWGTYRNADWYVARQIAQEERSIRLGFGKVSHLKAAVVVKLREYVDEGGFLFAMCSATDSYDIAQSAIGIDIVPSPFDGDGYDANAQAKLKFMNAWAFKDYTLSFNAAEYEFSSIDATPQTGRSARGDSGDYFTLFEFSAKHDPVPTMLTQCHTSVVKGFMGQTTAFYEQYIKPDVIIMGRVEGAGIAKYIHGNSGQGTWTFYGGHDPEDYRHRIQDPPTDLRLFPNSPGYRLILNNILFPAAKKKEQKT